MLRNCFLLLFLCLHGMLRAQSPARLSHINVPVKIPLAPLYRLAEQKLDTVFTSPNYPGSWVQPDCATRYKYRFRRSPLHLQANGNNMQLAFTGYYQIIGSTRGCAGTTALTPWTPACSCGFNEPERRVVVSFGSSFRIRPDYQLLTTITRNEPRALDPCTVCFWGQDVTQPVLDGLKAELDAAAKALRDIFGTVNLKPWIQQAWNLLNQSYAVPNAGYFNLHPKYLRMEQPLARNNELELRIGIGAAPAITFEPAAGSLPPLPNLAAGRGQDGFQINLEAAIRYDSLTRVLNSYLSGKRFEISEGLLSKHVVVQQTEVQADSSGNLLIRMDFGGSFNGTVFFTGRPVYQATDHTIRVTDLNYSLESKSFLLNTARWLFNKKIIGELRQRTVFPLSAYYDSATLTLNQWLNKEWTPGIRGEGSVGTLELETVEVQKAYLLIRSRCNGQLSVRVDAINL